MPCPALSCPIVVDGAWLVCNPWPWMLVRILVAFVPVHGFLPEACGFLPGSLGPTWVEAMADVCIPLIKSLSQLVMRRVFALGYMRPFHGGDIFLLSLLTDSSVVLTAGRPSPQKGSIDGFPMGPAFHGGQAFPER
jgi:hypothetical protein